MEEGRRKIEEVTRDGLTMPLRDGLGEDCRMEGKILCCTIVIFVDFL
jgi:hypothetical protein